MNTMWSNSRSCILLLDKKKKYTPLSFIIKALVATLKLFPNFNSSIDDIENGKIVIKKYFHIGIAVDTPHGLMAVSYTHLTLPTNREV